MSALSPASVSAEPAGIVSPPSTSVTPVPPPTKPAEESDEKIAYQKPVPEEGIEAVRPVNDDNLPEVVPEGHTFSNNHNNNNSSPSGMQYPVDSKSAMRSADEAQGIVPPEQMQTPPPAFQQQPPVYSNSMPIPPPVNQSTTNFPTDDQTVTPLHLLGDQSDTIDCPFCRRRSMTLVMFTGSWLTHIWAVMLFFLTFFGAVAPYYFHWNSNVSHWCKNCDRKVAYRNFGSSKMNPLGTPDHLREVSKFQAVETPTGMNPNAAQQV